MEGTKGVEFVATAEEEEEIRRMEEEERRSEADAMRMAEVNAERRRDAALLDQAARLDVGEAEM